MRCDKPMRSLLILLMVCVAAAAAHAEDAQPNPSTVRKSQENLNFQLPPDWPIERRGGMVGPIPVEEYLAMKFKTLDARLQTIEQKLNGLDLRLRILEDANSRRPAAGLKSSESR